jgi:hypothetical protein
VLRNAWRSQDGGKDRPGRHAILISFGVCSSSAASAGPVAYRPQVSGIPGKRSSSLLNCGGDLESRIAPGFFKGSSNVAKAHRFMSGILTRFVCTAKPLHRTGERKHYETPDAT